MALSLIQKIYDEYNDALGIKDSYETTLDYFKRNFVLYDNIDSFSDDLDLILFIELSFLHVNALLAKGYYNETVDRSTKALMLIDREFEANTEIPIPSLYWEIIFLQGRALYKLKDYNGATMLFKYLVNTDPGNDMYKDWLNSSQYHERQWIAQAMYIIAIALIISEITLKTFIPAEVRIFMDVLGFSMILFNVVYYQYAERSFRKNK
jgi:tetratricopeptide (TPR) repeat protein